MEELLKQQLEYYSNVELTLPKPRKISLPRYDRDSSFSQFSNWTDSDKFCTSRLPRISSQVQQKANKIIARNQSYSQSNCCPIKQMQINLLPISNNDQSFYNQYLKTKAKRPYRQMEFTADFDKEKRKMSFNRCEILSTGKIKEIIKRKKDNRFSLLHQQYLRTTQLLKHLESKNER